MIKKKSHKDVKSIAPEGVALIDCKLCKGSGEEEYIYSWQDCGGAHRPFYSERVCTKCAGVGKLKIKLSNIKDV